MESETQLPAGGSKRKAEDLSPERGSPPTAIVGAENHRKRRDKICDGNVSASMDATVIQAEGDYTSLGERQSDGDNDDDVDEESDEEPDEKSDEKSDEESDEDEEDLYNDEEEPPKLEIEEVKHQLEGGCEVNFEIFRCGDEGLLGNWKQKIQVYCKSQGNDIGDAFGHYIKRDWIKHDFWTEMGWLMANWRLLPLKYLIGTGVWGNELDLGDLFILEEIQVNREWRRKGLGTKMMTYLLRKSQSDGRMAQFIIVRPGWLHRDIIEEVKAKSLSKVGKRKAEISAVDVADAFYRSFGFRRIGASSCFALALDLSHKSRTLPAGDDFDPIFIAPQDTFETEITISGNEQKEPGTSKQSESHKPLYEVIGTLSDPECVQYLETFLKDIGKDSFDVEIQNINSCRDNILHTAAVQLKLETLHWLLGDADPGKRLSAAANIKSCTPLDALRQSLEDKRTVEKKFGQRICVSDDFKGHSPEAIGCLASLLGLENIDTDQYIQLKYGCNCGQCVKGFLSPRMKFALLCQAERHYDTMFADDMEGWVDLNQHMLEWVQPYVRQSMCTNKSLIQGFINIFNHVATTMKANEPPTMTNVLSTLENSDEWPPATKTFLQRGGTVESVLQIVFRFARDQDEWAEDGEHMESFADEVNQIPKCRNDHEFGFVALACGIKISQPVTLLELLAGILN